MGSHLHRLWNWTTAHWPILVAIAAALVIGVAIGSVRNGSSGSTKTDTTSAPSRVIVATRITNEIQLDNGTCGTNLQLGNDKTASPDPTPTFLISGDGGASVYTAAIDGHALSGQFTSDGYGNVCVTTTTPLTDGDHLLTAHEVRPNPQDLTPFAFSVDTVIPATPSTPELSAYSDSPPVGDGTTKYRNINFHGTSDPGVSIQLYSGPTGLAGALADAQGNWSATTSTLADGTYNIAAAAFDQAGNKSKLSGTTTIRISQTGEVNTPGAPSLNSANRAVVLNWSAPASDGNTPITSYKIYQGVYGATNTLIAQVGGNVFTYTVPDAAAWQYFAVSAVNAQGEGPKSNGM